MLYICEGATCQLHAVIHASRMYHRRVQSRTCYTVHCHQIYKSYQKRSRRFRAPDARLQLHVSAVGVSTKLLRQRLCFHLDLRCLSVTMSVWCVIRRNWTPSTPKQQSIFLTWPLASWLPCLPKYQKSPGSLRFKSSQSSEPYLSSCIVLYGGSI